MKKIESFHREIEVKVLLEVLAVYAVLALIVTGIYFFGPTITGMFTVTKQLNYTDDVNLQFNESGTYIWNLANPGNLKSIKVSGSKSEEGEARVYIEDEGIRYLIFDSSRLVEKESGIFGITGFAVFEEIKDEIKTDIEGTLNDEQQEIFDLLVLDINQTRNNVEIEIEADEGEVSKKIKGTITELQQGLVDGLSSSLENLTGVKIRIESEFEEQEEVEAPINETPTVNETINDTIINETEEKIINIDLEYGDNEVYDADNDGVENLDGIIDFNVKNSDFNWDVDAGKLCTRYEVYSVEDEESTFACFGNNDCCNFVDLQSSRESWDDSLLLTYGSYGSSNDNLIFAQVLYVDYNLSSYEPYTDIAYSSWDNLTAQFIAGIIEFEDVCIDTCLFDGNASNYKLIAEINGAILNIDEIKYSIEERVINNDPLLAKQIENVSVLENHEYVLDLNEYFYDDDNDELIYSYYDIDNLTIRFENNLAYIIPDENFIGSRFTFITASDGYGQAASNVFKIEVKSSKLVLEILESRVVEENWTVSFSTIGTGNLTISAINGTSYSEFYNDNLTTTNDIGALELRCGDFEIFDKEGLIENEDLRFVLMNDSKIGLSDLLHESMPIKGIYVEDYSCDNYGYYTVRLLAGGISTQEFKFGNETMIVNNVYAVAGKFFEIRDKEDNKLMAIEGFGNLNIMGNLTQNSDIIADENDFVIQISGFSLAAVTNPEGNLLIRGSLNENQNLLQPTPNSFIIEDENGEVIAYVNSTGSLFLKGTLAENVLLE